MNFFMFAHTKYSELKSKKFYKSFSHSMKRENECVEDKFV